MRRKNTVTTLLLMTMKSEYSTGISSTSCCMAPVMLKVTIKTAMGPF